MSTAPASSSAPVISRPRLPTGPMPWLRRASVIVLGGYMRLWHDLRVQGYEYLPSKGPALVLSNHVSLLDVVTLAVANPWPDSTLVVKEPAFRVPVLGHVLRAWSAIPVARHGRDVAGLRAMMNWLRSGRIVALAAEGRRSRSGRLEAVNPVLARLAANTAVPLVPVGIVGTHKAMPRGTFFPRRRPVLVRIGKPFLLSRATSSEEAARRIQEEIAALLPPELQPQPHPNATPDASPAASPASPLPNPSAETTTHTTSDPAS